MKNSQANTVAKSDSGTSDTVALNITLALASDNHEPTVRDTWALVKSQLHSIGIDRGVSDVHRKQPVTHGQIG